MITIKNKKTYNGPGIYIGRPTIFGNPFGLSDYTREEAILEYKLWLEKQPNDSKIKKALKKLAEDHKNDILYGELVLICWCSPEDCHGQVLKDYIERII